MRIVEAQPTRPRSVGLVPRPGDGQLGIDGAPRASTEHTPDLRRAHNGPPAIRALDSPPRHRHAGNPCPRLPGVDAPYRGAAQAPPEPPLLARRLRVDDGVPPRLTNVRSPAGVGCGKGSEPYSDLSGRTARGQESAPATPEAVTSRACRWRWLGSSCLLHRQGRALLLGVLDAAGTQAVRLATLLSPAVRTVELLLGSAHRRRWVLSRRELVEACREPTETAVSRAGRLLVVECPRGQGSEERS